jgi:hypothetical protein
MTETSLMERLGSPSLSTIVQRPWGSLTAAPTAPERFRTKFSSASGSMSPMTGTPTVCVNEPAGQGEAVQAGKLRVPVVVM